MKIELSSKSLAVLAVLVIGFGLLIYGLNEYDRSQSKDEFSENIEALLKSPSLEAIGALLRDRPSDKTLLAADLDHLYRLAISVTKESNRVNSYNLGFFLYENGSYSSIKYLGSDEQRVLKNVRPDPEVTTIIESFGNEEESVIDANFAIFEQRKMSQVVLPIAIEENRKGYLIMYYQDSY